MSPTFDESDESVGSLLKQNSTQNSFCVNRKEYRFCPLLQNYYLFMSIKFIYRISENAGEKICLKTRERFWERERSVSNC